MLMKISRQVSHDLTKCMIIHHNMMINPSSKRVILSLKQAQGFRILLSTHARSVSVYNSKKRRNVAVFSSTEPGLPPSGNSSIISWIVAVVVAVVIPLVNYKWGPNLKKRVMSAMQVTEDVVEVVEKVAEEVEKVAEEVDKVLPPGGKLKEAVDFIENLADLTAKEAGAIDDFIDQVQDEEEKAEKFAESLEDELKKQPSEKSDEEDKLEK